MGQHNSTLRTENNGKLTPKENSSGVNDSEANNLREKYHERTGKLIVERSRRITARSVLSAISCQTGGQKKQAHETEKKSEDRNAKSSGRPRLSSWGLIKTSTAEPPTSTGIDCKRWGCVTAKIRLNPNGPTLHAFLDSCNEISVVDRAWLRKHRPHLPLHNTTSIIPRQGIASCFVTCTQFVVLPIYFQGVDDKGNRVLGLVEREIHVTDNLEPKLLLGIDVMAEEEIDVLISQKKVVINSCGVMVPIVFEKPVLERGFNL